MLPAAGSDGVPRRARGALEAAIMDVLWRAQGPLSPGEVRDLLGTCADAEARALSYSTVVTILTRLHGKRRCLRARAWAVPFSTRRWLTRQASKPGG